MLAGPDLQLPVVPLEDGLGHAGIVQQSQSVVSCVCEAVKPMFVDTHAQCNGPHDVHVQLLTRLEEARHMRLEGVGLVVAPRPHVGHVGLVIATDFHALLQVWDCFTQLRLCARLFQDHQLLAPLRHIAAVRCGRVPRQCIFLGLRPCEEAG